MYKITHNPQGSNPHWIQTPGNKYILPKRRLDLFLQGKTVALEKRSMDALIIDTPCPGIQELKFT